jgi:hypothetical protein
MNVKRKYFPNSLMNCVNPYSTLFLWDWILRRKRTEKELSDGELEIREFSQFLTLVLIILRNAARSSPFNTEKTRLPKLQKSECISLVYIEILSVTLEILTISEGLASISISAGSPRPWA